MYRPPSQLMKTMTKTFICITLVGFALALVSCGAESLPPEPEMIISDEEKALLVQIEGAGDIGGWCLLDLESEGFATIRIPPGPPIQILVLGEDHTALSTGRVMLAGHG